MSALDFEPAGPIETAVERRPDEWNAAGGVQIGTLVGFMDAIRTPLVVCPGQSGTAAIPALTTVDLHGAHVGSRVVLVFENNNPERPIVVGRLRDASDDRQRVRVAHVEVEADGERLIVAAKSQLVLQCGKASITLTQAGKVLISGTYLSSHSTGANRIKGGTIQLN